MTGDHTQWSCAQYAALYGVGNGECDANTIATSENCDDDCKKNPRFIQSRCPKTCGKCKSSVQSNNAAGGSGSVLHHKTWFDAGGLDVFSCLAAHGLASTIQYERCRDHDQPVSCMDALSVN